MGALRASLSLALVAALGCSDDGTGLRPLSSEVQPTGPWMLLGAPLGGVSSALLIHSDGTVWVGTDEEGVYRSEGSGWVRLTAHRATPRVYALAEGSGGAVVSASFAGLFRTADQGASWQQVGPVEESYLALLRRDDGSLFAGSFSRGVLRSADGGATWTATSGPSDGAVFALAEGEGGAVLAGTQGGLWRSTDAGATWTRILDLAWVNALLADGSLVLAGSRFGGAFRSDDGGATWTSLSGRFAPLPGAFPESFALDGEGRPLAVTDNLVHRSADGGRTWSALPWPRTDYIAQVAAAPDGRLYFAAADGVWVSDDHGQTRRPVGLRPLRVESAAALPAGLLLGAWTDLSGGDYYWRIAGGGGFWTPGGAFRDAIVRAVLPLGGDAAVAALSSLEEAALGGLYRSTDGGRSWALTPLHSRGVLSLARDRGVLWAGTGPGQPGTPEGETGSVHRSTDGGVTWTDLGLGSVLGTLGLEVRQVVTDGAGSLYARVFDPDDAVTDIYRSGGSGSWVRATPAGSDRIDALVAREDGSLLAGTENGRVLRSGDGGRSWSPVGSMPGGEAVTALAWWNGTLWAGTERGLFESADHGATWKAVGEISPAASVTFLSETEGGTVLLGGSERHGLFRKALSGG